MSTNEQTLLSQPTSALRNTLGREQAPQNLVRPVSDEDLREYCDKNYHKILPIIAEKLHQEKAQQEKLKAVKARLNFEEASQYFESETPKRRRNLKERLGPRDARTRSESPEQRRGRSKSPREKGPERRTVFKRLEKCVFHRLGDKEKNVSAHSRGSERKSYYCSRRDTESCYKSSRSKETKIGSEKHRHKREYSRRMEAVSESEGSAGGNWKSKPKKQKSSTEDDLSQPWVCEEMDPFTLRIRYFDFLKTRMPSHIKTYDGSEDPKDHLKIFQAAAKTERWAMPTWFHMFNSTLTENARVWFDDLPKESIDNYDDLGKAFLKNYLQQKKCIKDPVEIHNIKQRNRESAEEFVRRGEMAASNRKRKKSFPSWKHEAGQKQNFKRGNFQNEQRMERKQDIFTLLTKTPIENLALDKGKFKHPPPMTTPVEKRNASKFCEFNMEVGHTTDECMHLKRQIKETLKAGKLSHLIKELKQNHRKDHAKIAKKGETSRKDKPLAILMGRKRDGRSYDHCGRDGRTLCAPHICGWRLFLENLVWALLQQISSGDKNQLIPANTPLVGFSGEIIWPLGQISLLVKVGDEEHSTFARINFMVVRSPSPYNRIIGRLRVRKIRAIPSTSYGMIKFPVAGGIVTLQSSRIIPLECLMISEPGVPWSAINKVKEEKIQVAIHPEHPEQTIAIGSTLTDEGRKELCGLLRRHLDVFVWKPTDMTGVTRHIAEHRLNVREGCLPVRQKKKGQAPERNKAISEEVKKLVDADIMKEFHYHSWLSNPVMVNKHDDSWRMCVDFKDLNKACPKDGYPLPKIDWKVESLCGYPYKCFLDAYKGYHQIKMAEEDEEKTPFITSQGIFCYSKTSFGLKNAGATYQRLCTKKSDFQWTPEAEGAFKEMKQSIAELSMLTAPKEKEELIIYLAAAKKAISAVLMTERDGKQVPIYFVSRALQGLEINYTPIEKLMLALYRPRTSVKGQILADFIVEHPEDGAPDTPMEDKEELPDPWILFTDGSSCVDGSGTGLIIMNPEGMEFTYSLRFRFNATNNEAEYEARIAGLRIASQIGIQNLQANVDSKLVANQVNRIYIAKESSMIRYLEKVKNLTNTFKGFSIKQIPRWENKKADALSKISSANFAHLSKQVLVEELGEKEIDEKEILVENLTPITSPWPFYKWGIEIAGPFPEGPDKEPRRGNQGTVGRKIKIGWKRAKAVIAAEIDIPTLRTTEVDMAKNNEALGISLDLLEEKRKQAAIQEARNKAKMKGYYNTRVQSTSFRPGDFVYQNNEASHMMLPSTLRNVSAMSVNALYQPWIAILSMINMYLTEEGEAIESLKATKVTKLKAAKAIKPASDPKPRPEPTQPSKAVPKKKRKLVQETPD
nr:hypothetical protein [Tanacetum cinerariifolium]